MGKLNIGDITECEICPSKDIIEQGGGIFCNKCGTLYGWVRTEKDIQDEKFLWLQALHIVEDVSPEDNPATGSKTIDALYEKFEIKLRK
ncbi:MAG: hypothetical protein SLAVMIC_00726 [uncultured marine phage]|uniref:Uncharacterized protein n=1 Tax=uncultured marine phage TaxID=707152 RepID=A0A8D9CFM6_9VIRU|nr:MAG: hypothetical protein SLAVMIC_00726 [uncultured marine phage]